MMSLWPHWQRPFVFLILPLLIWLIWKLWHFHEIKGSWRKLIPVTFQPWLLRGTSAQESSIPKIIFTLGTLLAFIALLGPSWKHVEQPPLKIDSPLVVVLDLTPNMFSHDIPPSRLESAKRKILDIIANRKDAQTAIVVYSGSAHTVTPLSDDQATITNLLSAVSPNIMPKIGNRADLGVKKALQLLDNTEQQKNAQILLVTTGLSETEQTDINKLLAGKSIPLNILGVGTSQGAPIMAESGSFLKDAAGNIILPRLDSASLQKFAYHEGGYYSTITLNDDDIKTLHVTDIDGDKRTLDDKEKKTSDLWQDQGYWLLLPLLLLVALGARKGWLLCIPVLFILQPQPANAFEFNQLWLNRDQQGQQLLKENKPAEAAKRFKNKRWQGYAEYAAKNYQDAEKRFVTETTPEGLYNYGNVLARQGKYQEAIANWDKAIEAKADFTQAIKNKKLVEDLLKKQQEQREQQGSEQDNNQQQNSEQNNSQQQTAGQKNQQQNAQQEQQTEQQKKEQAQQSSAQQQKNSQSNDDAQQTNDLQQTDQQNSKNKDSFKNKDKLAKQGETQQTNDASAMDQQNDDQQYDSTQEIEGQQQNTTQDAQESIHNLERKELLEREIQSIPINEPSELLRKKFYYEQQSNRGDY